MVLTATVTVASGTPTGTVQFLVNNAFAGGTVALTNGIATFTYVTSCSTLGPQMMSAAYSGDATYAGSKGPALALGSAGNPGGALTTSNGSIITTPLIVTVTSGTCPDFTVTPSQTAVTVAAGATIPPVTITVAPLNSFTGAVSFTASATTTTAYLPTLAFSPTFVAITTSASGTTSLNFTGIVADLHTPKMPDRAAPVPWYAVGSGVTIASLLMFALPRKRRMGGILALLLAVALVGGATGCGNSSQVVQTPNPYAGTYVVTVVATYTSVGKPNISHSTTITYQIN